MNNPKIFVLLQIFMVCLVAVGHRRRLAFWGLMMQKGCPALMKDYNCALLKEGKLEVS